MALPYRKVVLIEGDLTLTLPVIAMIRKSWFPEGVTPHSWVVLDPPTVAKDEKDYCRLIAAELALDILGGQRVVILRGFPSRKDFREWLFKLVPLIESPNSLLIWDIDGVIEKSDDSEWRGLRNEVKGHGQCVVMPMPLNAKKKNKNNPRKPLDVYSDEEKLQYVMHAFQSKGCTIMPSTAQALLNMVGADRGMIDTEVEKLLLFCNGKSIEVETLLQTVVPVAQEYPRWQFNAAFSGGDYHDIMNAANALLSAARERKDGRLDPAPKPEWVMACAMRQCHWQLVAADLLRQGKDVASGLRHIGTAKEAESTRQKIWKKLSPRLREKAQQKCRQTDEKKSTTDSEEKGQEILFGDPQIRNITDFLAKLLRRCPPGQPDPHVWAWCQALERFRIAHEALVQLRVMKDDAALTLMGQELRKLSL